MKKAQKYSRIILSVGLAVAVYTETGIFTAIAALVLLLGMEAVASSTNKIRAHVLNMDRMDLRAEAEKMVNQIMLDKDEKRRLHIEKMKKAGRMGNVRGWKKGGPDEVKK